MPSPALVTVTTPLLNSFSLMAAVLKSPRIRPPQDAVAPVAEKFAPGKSLDSVGPFQFSAVEGAPSLQGKWGFPWVADDIVGAGFVS